MPPSAVHAVAASQQRAARRAAVLASARRASRPSQPAAVQQLHARAYGARAPTQLPLLHARYMPSCSTTFRKKWTLPDDACQQYSQQYSQGPNSCNPLRGAQLHHCWLLLLGRVKRWYTHERAGSGLMVEGSVREVQRTAKRLPLGRWQCGGMMTHAFRYPGNVPMPGGAQRPKPSRKACTGVRAAPAAQAMAHAIWSTALQ